MLEHADGDDAVEFLIDVAIIPEFKGNPVRQAFLPGAALGDRELARRQRHALYPRARYLGEIEAKSAPARSDIEHALIGRGEKFRREMAPLRQLRIVETVPSVLSKYALVSLVFPAPAAKQMYRSRP